MLDTTALTQLVEQEIKTNVQRHVSAVISDVGWINNMEQQVIDFAQARLLAKFNNVGAVPELVSMVKHSVGDLFAQGQIPNIANFVDTKLIDQSIDSAVTKLVTSTLDNLSVDPQWLARIENLIVQNYTQKISRHLSAVDIDSLVAAQLESSIDKWQERFRKNFKTSGIEDTAQSRQLGIEDNLVIVENQLVARGLHVVDGAEISGDLTVKNLAVTGTVNVDNKSWDQISTLAAGKALDKITSDWKTALVAEVLELSRTQGIDFKDVLINGKALVSNNQLNATITHSNLENVGTLKQLTVSGPATITDTFNVVRGRVGINTQQPEMALSVWDEEVAVMAGKLAKDQAFIGTSRNQSLTLGVNRSPYLEIDTSGLVTVKQLRIDRWKISHGGTEPGHTGTRGDVIFNSDPKPGTPFAWVCLGGLRWQPVRGV